MTTTDTSRTILLVAAGAALGGTVAFAAAFGLATYYIRRLDDAKSCREQSAKPGACQPDAGILSSQAGQLGKPGPLSLSHANGGLSKGTAPAQSYAPAAAPAGPFTQSPSVPPQPMPQPPAHAYVPSLTSPETAPAVPLNRFQRYPSQRDLVAAAASAPLPALGRSSLRPASLDTVRSQPHGPSLNHTQNQNHGAAGAGPSLALPPLQHPTAQLPQQLSQPQQQQLAPLKPGNHQQQQHLSDAQLVEGESPRAPGQPQAQQPQQQRGFVELPQRGLSGGGAGGHSLGHGVNHAHAVFHAHTHGHAAPLLPPPPRKASPGPPAGGLTSSTAAAAQDRVQKAALDMMMAAAGGAGGLAGKLGVGGNGANGNGGGAAEGKTSEQLAASAAGDDYSRVITPETAMTDEVEEVCALLVECLELRKHWLFKPALSPEARRHEPEAAVPSDINPQPFTYVPLPHSGHTFRMVDGVMAVYGPEDRAQAHNLFPVPGTAAEFFTDMHRILRYAASGPVKSYCHHRLMLLEQKFNLHVMLNSDKEFRAQKAAPHRDFYNVRKVDTHIHHSACMHQKHLLRFIKSKLRKEPDEVVIFRDGKYLTLKEVFESLKLTGYDLNVDTLDMHADKNTFHRFDKFNLKYNPCGQSRLREIFIKQDNLIHGRFLAELTREVFSDLESSKYQHAEMRISVYGRKAMEWDILAAWVVGFQLHSDNNVWLIQIPRLYNVYKETGVIENFQQMIDNIFEPLFEVTADPSTHPQLHVLLAHVVGFDMVDDESKPERRPTKHSEPPQRWNSKHNCAYAYYAYYIYANLYALNKFRESRGLNTFTFRPHAGEAGDIDHLVASFMLCDNIAHGINLRKSPCLQYLYYLAQIGLCMSPLSNNSLFLDYHRNPFPLFFARGLSVSLSTDDPVMIHLTKEPLVEEYSVAAQVFKMSSADLCEIARNGVLHSGFPHACKKHWVAEEYWRPGPDGNDIHKTNVPNLRLRFRHETYCNEMRLVLHGAVANQTRKAALMAARGEA